MKFLTFLCAISAFVPAILAGPAGIAVNIDTYSGEKTGRHIVTLKEGVARAPILGKVASLLAGKSGKGITYEYDTIFNGFAGTFDSVTLAALQLMPGVESIAEDGILHTTDTQPNAPWGLSRISSRERLTSDAEDPASALNYKYSFDDRAGEGVVIYVVDTGVRTTHDEFGGRARWGATFGGYEDADGNGHGTHCAGTAVGGQFGVAKRATVTAVKVLSDEGSGSTTDIIAGLNWVASDFGATGKPSVVSMSLGGLPNPSLNSAVQSLVKKGVHVVVAAGNSNQDALLASPANVPEAITVGASNITDGRAFFSNYGFLVDVFAPGVNVTSAWSDSDTATARISGTSMATPHVAGLVAYLISVDGQMKPADMSKKVKDLALKDVLSDIPLLTANRLANNGYTGA